MGTRMSTPNEKWSATVAELMPMLREECDYACRKNDNDPDECMGAAAIGVLNALDRFDASKGKKFVHYAKDCVRRAIADEARVSGPIPRHSMRKIQMVAEATERAKRKHGQPPTIPEVAVELGQSVKNTERWMRGVRHRDSVPIGECHSLRIAGEPQLLDARDVLAALTRALTEQETYILWRHYGEDVEQKELARHLGCSASHICHVLDRIGGKLRARIDATKMGGHGTAALRTEKERKNGRKPDRAPVLHGRVAV